MSARRNTQRCIAGVCIAAGLIILGCAHDQKPRSAAPTARVAKSLVVPTVHPPPVYVLNEAPPVLMISPSVRAKCELPAPSDDSRERDFDQVALRPRGEELLDRIAACMRDGPLREQGVRVIGRGDPQGLDRYAPELGMERARTARDYLIKKSVTASSVQVESRSEQGGAGAGSLDRQIDRRVEIEELAPSR